MVDPMCLMWGDEWIQDGETLGHDGELIADENTAHKILSWTFGCDDHQTCDCSMYGSIDTFHWSKDLTREYP